MAASIGSSLCIDPDVQPLLDHAQELHLQAEPLHSWSAIHDILAQCDLGALKRTDEMLEYYESVGPLLKQRYGSLANFIRYKLDFASSPMHQLHTEQLPPVFMAQALPDITRICLNDFPYSIPREDGAHYVVWSQVPLTNASMAESDDEWQLVLDKGLSGFTGYHEWDADGLATGKDSAGREIRAFVLNKWPPALGWQTMLYVTRM